MLLTRWDKSNYDLSDLSLDSAAALLGIPRRDLQLYISVVDMKIAAKLVDHFRIDLNLPSHAWYCFTSWESGEGLFSLGA